MLPMAQANIIAFNIGAFISTLFLLESGADKFTAHAAALASRIGISEVTIGLVTAGAEWEEVSGSQVALNKIVLYIYIC